MHIKLSINQSITKQIFSSVVHITVLQMWLHNHKNLITCLIWTWLKMNQGPSEIVYRWMMKGVCMHVQIKTACLLVRGYKIIRQSSEIMNRACVPLTRGGYFPTRSLHQQWIYPLFSDNQFPINDHLLYDGPHQNNNTQLV